LGIKDNTICTGETTPRNTNGGETVLQKLNLFLVTWDLPTMTPGSDAISWEEIRAVVDQSADLLWDMKGERRVLPSHILTDVLRIHEGNGALMRLGRSSECAKPVMFTRGQTLSS
jgi:hypothetical protein